MEKRFTPEQEEIIKKLQNGDKIQVIPAQQLSTEQVQAFIGLFWKKLIKIVDGYYVLTAMGREVSINAKAYGNIE